MGRPLSVVVGDSSDGVRVEHVRAAGVIRLVHPQAGRTPDDAMGLSVPDFCARLGITAEDLGSPLRYLLVAGGHCLGSRHVALFSSVEKAREAFVTVRRSDSGTAAWAELLELPSGGPARRLSWYGPAGIWSDAENVPARIRSDWDRRSKRPRMHRARFIAIVHATTRSRSAGRAEREL